MMGKAIQRAAQENLAAGLRTASFLDGKLVVTPGGYGTDRMPDSSGIAPTPHQDRSSPRRSP